MIKLKILNVRRNRKKTHKLTDSYPKPSLLHVVISSVIGFNKFFYSVVLYVNYLICIFMNIYANLKNDGKSLKSNNLAMTRN